MIINNNIQTNLLDLNKNIELVLKHNSLTNLQLENFLRNMEKNRFNILNEIKLHNKHVEFEYNKISTIDNEYKAEFKNDVLKIYIPEIPPSYKNIKTHTHKRILLNVSEITKTYANLFGNKVFIYIKVFDKSLTWDIDNKYIKPIADALVLSGVIQDDNITKMFYCAKGEYSETPHTEVFVFDGAKIDNFLEIYSTK